MRRNFFRWAVALCASLHLVFLLGGSAGAQGKAPEVSAQSAVLISADTASVIFSKNAWEKRAMASTTKIMTALLALEEAEREGDSPVTVTDEMVAVEGSSMGLQAGDVITLRNLAAGMLLASGNDAANAAALFLDGSQEDFAERMNSRAQEIGMVDTHFVTPSGLDDEQHYSTAYDMALLAREALKNESFRELASSAKYQVEFISPEKKVTYANHNKLLTTVAGCIGVKTGFTKKAGRCLVSAAERDGAVLIAVTLNAPDDWNDHAAMLDYGFSMMERVSFSAENFSARLPLVGSDASSVEVRGGTGGFLTLPESQAAEITSRVLLPSFCYAPVKVGDKLGKIQYYLDGVPLYSISLVAADSAAVQAEEPGFWQKLFGRT